MGFRPFEADESISASFVSLSVYEIRGINLQPDAPLVVTGTIENVSYRIGIGNTLNKTCETLAGDIYVDDEASWLKEKDTRGPFLLIQVGATPLYKITTGHIKRDSKKNLTTYESFPSLRSDLAAIEAKVLPRLETSISCSLTTQYLELKKIDRIYVGQTDSGMTIHDIKFHLSANMHVSQSITSEVLTARLHETAALVLRINNQAARFFALGIAEDDELKKFLYFFLAIEIETNSVFKRIDHARAIEKLIYSEPPLPAALLLLSNQSKQLDNLFDKFVWNTACIWNSLTEEDVQKFKQLKTIRNEIAHGRRAEPSADHTSQARQLAAKILRF